MKSFYLLIRDSKKGSVVFDDEVQYFPFTVGSSKSCDVHVLKLYWGELDTLVIAEQDHHFIGYSLNQGTSAASKNGDGQIQTIQLGKEFRYGHLSFYLSQNRLTKSPSAERNIELTTPDTKVGDLDDENTDYIDNRLSSSDENLNRKYSNTAQTSPVKRSPPPPEPPKSPTTSGQNSNNKPINRSSPTPPASPIKEVRKADDKKISELIDKNRGFESLRKFQSLNLAEEVPADKRVIHGFVTWKGEIYDSKLFFQQEPIRLGPDRDGLYLPFLDKPQVIGLLDKGKANIALPNQKTNAGVENRSENIILTLEDLKAKGAYRKKGSHNMVKLVPNEVLEICFEHDISVYFFIDSPPEKIFEKGPRSAEQLFKEALKKSGTYHGIFLILALLYSFNTPPPKIKDVPTRVAKLVTPPMEKLIEPPPVIPEEPPPPEPKEPEVKKSEPEKPKPEKIEKKEIAKIPEPKPLPEKKPLPSKKKIVQPPPKKIFVKQPLKRPPSNMEPTRSESPSPTVDVTESVGALAALGALNIPSGPVNQKPVALKLNTNNANTNNVRPQDLIGAINMKGGQLPPTGSTGIQTKGRSFDPSQEIQVGGLAGSAGKRETLGTVMGRPDLLQMSSQEGLSQKIVMEVVKKHVGEIQRCYEKALMSQPNISGRVEFEWLIQPSGKVQWAKVKSSNIQNGGVLTSCVKEVFERMKFPVAKNGESTQPSIGLPFGTL